MLFCQKENVNRKKVFILFILSAVTILAQLLMRLPDLVRLKNTPAEKWYTGQASWFDPWDLNVYFSAIGWGKRGGILFQNLYDTQSSGGLPIYSLYTILGKVSSPFNLSNALTFHLTGLVTSFFLIMIIWWFIKIFLENEIEKVVAFTLILLGGGLGWLFFPKNLLPDIGQPGFTLASALQRPHEAVSLGLFLLSLGSFWQAIVLKNWRLLVCGSLGYFLMLFFHPYSALPLGAILFCFGVYWWLKTDSREFLKVFVSLGVWAGAYFLLAGKDLLANPTFSGLASQVQDSPSLVYAILGWGLLFPFAVVAFFSREKSDKALFFKMWLVVQWLIIYLPFGFRRLMIRGLWIPVAILAVKGIRIVASKIKWDYYLTAGLLLFFASFSTLYVSYKRLTETPENRWIYLTRQEGETINYLKTHGQDEEEVLASYRIGNLIPAHTKKRVYLGHSFQTPNAEERMGEIYRFFAGKMTEVEAREFLGKAKITWVFWGPDEKAIGGLTTIPAKRLLQPVIEKEQVSLYKVIQSKK